MKKKILIVLVSFLGGMGLLRAQESSLGIKAGVNFSTLTGDGFEGLDSKTGYHFGIVGELGISEKFSIQPEVLYSTQGAESEDVDFDINYLNVPILAKIYFLRNISFQVGPQFGYVTDQSGDGFDLANVDLKDYDLSGAAGVEVKFKSIFLQGRYNFGLSDVTDSGTKNAVFQFSVGYNFL
ncbi:Outer membrane protein beta-barrel domain-containing protein [Pustulibacterium marinum]|uniref:Outer membrane protein beta-barrel domain-containing protein n=1 Tax=Pustulibacterium marinum TaxID=1224947 RepID=A0A1I7FQI9_9FLAO|nr:porin family protein [Pustulibacterium marinum]SFU38479.1 Outer membrane protein beta-barrel domain-containing protein [Pustulibacterium marinum]